MAIFGSSESVSELQRAEWSGREFSTQGREGKRTKSRKIEREGEECSVEIRECRNTFNMVLQRFRRE